MALLDFITSQKPADVERRLRMAQAMSGMSMHPNTGLQQAIQGRLQGIQDQRKQALASQQQNKTLAALQAAGADAEMLALAKADPSVMSAVLSAYVSKKFATPQTTEMERAYQTAKTDGYTGSYMDFIKEFKGAGASKTQVTVGGEKVTPAKPEAGTQIIEGEGGELRQVPIAGSSAAQEVQKQIATAQSSIQVIDEALKHAGLAAAVGPIDARTPTIMPDARAFEAYHNQIKGKAFLAAFESLKGGGQITEIEGQKAEQAIARLDLAQSEEDYKKALRDLREVLTVALKRNQGVWQSIPTSNGQPQATDPLGIR